ncbi:DNA-binding MarR family transcriptional regulator [Nocardia tenerifensis]|uniref:DNA-binding MarR family transcriptional regulator n=1 Tax=Nocardia tenerifensis TaxID=228006 RepID=A0A318KQJ1_9NOCA|nr:MarR family transcriptional regulator [Nocardia tenerifensis]PXX65197.1 DNA-binding MarR family transcriptional regulator [Nocardia tenerifensis]
MPDEHLHPRALLRLPTFALGKLHKAVHAEVGASLRDHWVLVCLEEFGELSQQQVSTTLGIDRSEMVRLVDGLERDGLVVRVRDTEDRRKYRLTVTRAGKKQSALTNARIAEATDRVLGRLDEQERRTLHRLALKAIGEEPDAAD